VLFDSHSREAHPHGSAFICVPDLHGLAGYLNELFQVDQSLSDPDNGMQWQAQLFNSISGHYFVCSGKDMTMSLDATKIMVESSVQLLRLRTQVGEQTNRLSEVTKELTSWRQQHEEWQKEREQLQANLREHQRRVAELSRGRDALAARPHITSESRERDLSMAPVSAAMPAPPPVGIMPFKFSAPAQPHTQPTQQRRAPSQPAILGSVEVAGGPVAVHSALPSQKASPFRPSVSIS
jgi:hypothetical protein